MSAYILLLLVTLATLSNGQQLIWKSKAKKQANGFPYVDMEVPAGKAVLVQFRQFSLNGEAESCDEDNVTFYVGDRQSIPFCGERSGEEYKLEASDPDEPFYIYANANFERSSQLQKFNVMFKLVRSGSVGDETPDLPFLEDDDYPEPSTVGPTEGPTDGPTEGPTAGPTSPPSDSFECGKPVDANRIVGGTEADPFSIPWQVGLTSPNSMKPWCGGTLISPRHVMTAAHCTEGETPDGFRVVVGEHNTATGADGVFHEIACIKDHPDYSFPKYDFSILTLKEPVDITSADSKARAACLPSNTSRLYDNGEMMTVSGWGAQEEGQSFFDLPAVLHHVEVPGVPSNVCQEDYNVGPFRPRITAEMMCAGLDEGGIDSCQGDSGGPLTHEENGTTDLVGVVSFGIGCARSTHYGVYARITEVLPWILEAGVKANENRC